MSTFQASCGDRRVQASSRGLSSKDWHWFVWKPQIKQVRWSGAGRIGECAQPRQTRSRILSLINPGRNVFLATHEGRMLTVFGKYDDLPLRSCSESRSSCHSQVVRPFSPVNSGSIDEAEERLLCGVSFGLSSRHLNEKQMEERASCFVRRGLRTQTIEMTIV